MSELIHIKVNIADKLFPLRVSSDEEESIRKAAELVNKKIKAYIEEYSIKDKQAAVSMCALELASELLNSENQKIIDQNNYIHQILEIEEILKEI